MSSIQFCPIFKHVSVLSHNICFSKYICDETLAELLSWEVTLIVNLCCPSEKLPPYQTPETVQRINYPIPDQGTLPDNQALELTHYLSQCLLLGHKICIHCKGGHGRSALMAGLLLGYNSALQPDQVLKQVREAHGRRIVMSPKWRRIGPPQTTQQKDQIRRLLR